MNISLENSSFENQYPVYGRIGSPSSATISCKEVASYTFNPDTFGFKILDAIITFFREFFNERSVVKIEDKGSDEPLFIKIEDLKNTHLFNEKVITELKSGRITDFLEEQESLKNENDHTTPKVKTLATTFEKEEVVPTPKLKIQGKPLFAKKGEVPVVIKKEEAPLFVKQVEPLVVVKKVEAPALKIEKVVTQAAAAPPKAAPPKIEPKVQEKNNSYSKPFERLKKLNLYQDAEEQQAIIGKVDQALKNGNKIIQPPSYTLLKDSIQSEEEFKQYYNEAKILAHHMTVTDFGSEKISPRDYRMSIIPNLDVLVSKLYKEKKFPDNLN